MRNFQPRTIASRANPSALRASFLLALLTMLLAACAQMSQLQEDLVAQHEKPPMDIILPIPVPLSARCLPDDAKLALASIIHHLRETDDSKLGVDWRKGADAMLAEPEVYGRLEVKDFTLQGYEPLNGSAADMRLTGIFSFSSPNGFRMATVFQADYSIKGKGRIQMNKVYTWPTFSPYPEVEAFFIPKKSMEYMNADRRRQIWSNVDTLYAFAAENAESVVATPEEAAAFARRQEKSFFDQVGESVEADGLQAYYLLVFAKDRIRPGAQFMAKVTTSKYNVAGDSLGAVKYASLQGWRVALLGAKQPLALGEPRYYVHVLFNEGKEFEWGTLSSIPLGRFPWAKIAPAEAEPRMARAQTVRIRIGEPFYKAALLNLADRNDAKLVQKKLADLGFYTSSIDGQFGKGSKKALRAFKKANHMPDNDTWNMKVQRALMQLPSP